MGQRAYRARLSLTPDELETVHALTLAGRKKGAEWDKLLDKIVRARKRAEADKFAPFDADHVRFAFNFEEPEES